MLLISVAKLKRLIRNEWAAAPPTKPMWSSLIEPHSPSLVDREALGSLAGDGNRIDPDEELPTHLCGDEVDSYEDELGPVPPNPENDPWAYPDFYTNDYNVVPTPRIMR